MIPVALAVREDGGGEAALAERRRSARRCPLAPGRTARRPDHGGRRRPARPLSSSTRDEDDAASRQVDVVETPEPPACAGTYTVVFNDFWNRFPASSGASVEEWLAANGATA